jgi:hypothetical protein
MRADLVYPAATAMTQRLWFAVKLHRPRLVGLCEAV